MLKWSNYNHVIKTDNMLRIYNTKTRGIVDIDESSYKILENYSIYKDKMNNNELSCVDELINAGYLTNSENECLDYIQELTNEYKNLTGKMMIYFIPSWRCDFRCPYCHYYENISDESEMDDYEIINSVAYVTDYITELYRKELILERKITVVLYGGEPLISLEKHLLFIDELMMLNEGIKISVYIITNGYNLNESILIRLQKYNIKGMQITIDGEKDIHNIRRCHKTHVDTFTQIIENVKNACMKYNITVTIRINVDEDNVLGIPSLLKYLREYGITKNLILSISPVFSNINVTGALSNTNVLREFDLIFKVANEYAYPFVFPTTLCSYYSKEFFAIANGKVYPCPSMSANDILPISTVYERKLSPNREFNCIGECKYCKWLPLCGGGCKYQNLKKNNICMANTYKYMIEAYMKNYSVMNRLLNN